MPERGETLLDGLRRAREVQAVELDLGLRFLIIWF